MYGIKIGFAFIIFFLLVMLIINLNVIDQLKHVLGLGVSIFFGSIIIKIISG